MGAGTGLTSEDVDFEPLSRQAGTRHGNGVAALASTEGMQSPRGFAPPGALLTDDYDRVIRSHEARENRPRVFDRLRMAPQTTRKPTSIETALKPVHSLPHRTDRLEGSRYDLDGALGWHPVDRRASDIAIDLGNH